MAILPTIFYCAALARTKVIIVGDPQQLPPIVQSNADYVYRAMGRNIFEVATTNSEQVNDMMVMLDTQYRMHPLIGDLVSVWRSDITSPVLGGDFGVFCVRFRFPTGHNGAAARVAPNVHGSATHIKYSIHSDDDSLHLDRQTNGLQDDHHHHQSCVRDSRRTDAGQQRRHRHDDLRG